MNMTTNRMKINKAQQLAVKRKYLQNPDGAKSYLEFRRRVSPSFDDDYVMMKWAGTYIGIEKDGYTHS